MQKTNHYRKSLMMFLCSLLLFSASLFFLFFRAGSKEATIKASYLLLASFVPTLLCFPLAFLVKEGDRLDYLFVSLYTSVFLVLLLPLGVSYKNVFIASFFNVMLSFLIRLCFRKPVFHGILFPLGLLYLIDKDGLTSLIGGKSILTNIQATPLSDLYSIRLLPFHEGIQALEKDGISLWRLFIGDYLGSIGGGFVILLVILILFLTFYKSLKGSVSLVYLLSLYLSFFLCFYLKKPVWTENLTKSLEMVLFNDFVFFSFVLSDSEYIRKNSLSTYALVLLSSASTFLLSYNVNSYLACLISLFFFDFLYPMFSSVKKKSASIPLFVVSLIIYLLPSVLIGLYL